jgi:hypothetical protein
MDMMRKRGVAACVAHAYAFDAAEDQAHSRVSAIHVAPLLSDVFNTTPAS